MLCLILDYSGSRKSKYVNCLSSLIVVRQHTVNISLNTLHAILLESTLCYSMTLYSVSMQPLPRPSLFSSALY